MGEFGFNRRPFLNSLSQKAKTPQMTVAVPMISAARGRVAANNATAINRAAGAALILDALELSPAVEAEQIDHRECALEQDEARLPVPPADPIPEQGRHEKQAEPVSQDP